VVLSGAGVPCLVSFALAMPLAEISLSFAPHAEIAGTLAAASGLQPARLANLPGSGFAAMVRRRRGLALWSVRMNLVSERTGVPQTLLPANRYARGRASIRD
jgi:hypothetical protein